MEREAHKTRVDHCVHNGHRATCRCQWAGSYWPTPYQAEAQAKQHLANPPKWWTHVSR